MSLGLPRTHRFTTVMLTAVAILLLLTPTMCRNATADEIPHENYELVGSDLGVLISILNTTIRYSEFALISMYDVDMSNVEQNLTVVRGLLTPAEQVLDRIRDVAGSYEDLSMMLPPFSRLSSQMDSFASMEVSMLESRSKVLLASQLPELTGEEMLAAMEAIQEFNSLLLQMGKTINDMLVSANDINSLVVEDERPFADNQLVPLIERLRELLMILEEEMDDITQNGVPWTETQPFLMLWLSSSNYYLDERIVGGGYLYLNGSFAVGRIIDITIDNQNLTSVSTSSGGKYDFSFQIPLNSSWLGTHSVQALSATPIGVLRSGNLTISIILIPTDMSMEIDPRELSLTEQFRAEATLIDVRGNPLANTNCELFLDGTTTSFATDDEGTYERVWNAQTLGYGTHNIEAIYSGELPYASSRSGIDAFFVNIPTSLNLTLFAERFLVGKYVTGNGTLHANGTVPVPGQLITISIDDAVVANSSTDDAGEFAFAIPTTNMTVGGHVIKAELLHRDIFLRYSMDQVAFNVYALKPGKYPFFPALPHWNELFSGETFPNVFIGPNSYFFWLLVLVMVGTTIKLLQMRRKRLADARKMPTESVQAIDQEPLAEPLVPVSAEELAADLEKAAPLSGSPNEKIVAYYLKLLTFLTRRAQVSIRSSMTHWEVARLLKSLGYPKSPVESATILFERAFYSNTTLSEADTISMSAALTNLVRAKGKGASDAV